MTYFRTSMAFMAFATVRAMTEMAGEPPMKEVPYEWLAHLAVSKLNAHDYSHKYVADQESIDHFMLSPKGSGVFAGITFPDRSQLAASCFLNGKDGFGPTRYTVVLLPGSKEHGTEGATAPVMVDVTAFPDCREASVLRLTG